MSDERLMSIVSILVSILVDLSVTQSVSILVSQSVDADRIE